MNSTISINRPQLDSIFATLSFDDMAWAIKNLTDRIVAAKPRVSVAKRKAAPFSMEELDVRLDKAERELAEGKCLTMNADETGEQFINRLLCI